MKSASYKLLRIVTIESLNKNDVNIPPVIAIQIKGLVLLTILFCLCFYLKKI